MRSPCRPTRMYDSTAEQHGKQHLPQSVSIFPLDCIQERGVNLSSHPSTPGVATSKHPQVGGRGGGGREVSPGTHNPISYPSMRNLGPQVHLPPTRPWNHQEQPTQTVSLWQKRRQGAPTPKHAYIQLQNRMNPYTPHPWPRPTNLTTQLSQVTGVQPPQAGGAAIDRHV